jgi:glycerol-3-phosphate dehydrogenase (NAD(P)+)
MIVGILGAGAWGTALALTLHKNGHKIILWGHNSEHLEAIKTQGVNDRYLASVALPEGWIYEHELAATIRQSDFIIVAVPSKALRETARRLIGFAGVVVSVTKGIEASTGLTMTGILMEEAPGVRIAALSGPSLALEVARGIPTAVVVASRDESISIQVQALFHRPSFRVYRSSDLIGIELGGALKNVIAIAAGVCDGLGYGDNAKAALITRGEAEMRRLGVACGARPETFSGLGGLGDLVVTCFSNLSRNRAFGEKVGRGGNIAEILATTVSAVEGYPTTRSAHQLAAQLRVEAPIISAVHAMLYEGKNVQQAVQDLLSRDSKVED